jgi:hypothetical protein
MMPDWKSEILRREPDEEAGEDLAANQRIYLMQRVQFYMHAASRWAMEAGEWHDKAVRLRREAIGAEVIAGILAIVIWYLIWRYVLRVSTP